MRDGFVRKSLKKLALIRYVFDLSITRFILKLQGEPAYKMRGTCCACGSCCETPMIRTYAPFFYLKSLRWPFLFWHRQVNGFELLSENRRQRIFTFKCTHLDPETKKCDAYSSRPGMCRDYPRNILYNTPPDFLLNCTFSPLAINADKINLELEKLNLQKEKLAEIRSKFYADNTTDK